MDLIEKQDQYIKKLINQSHLVYIQPDMEKELLFYLESDYEYESDDPFAIKQRNFNVDTRSDINDIEEALDRLNEDMFDVVDSACHENYERVKLHKLYFSIGLCMHYDQDL